MKINYIIAFLLISLSILLTILVPGGPIETRDFSSYSPFVLTLFNIFLTSLGILSFLGAYLVIKNKTYSVIISAFFAICYIAVYISDLFKIFPVSPIPMPQTLFIIEVISTILGFVLLYICIKYNNFGNINKENITLKLSFYKIILLLVVLLFAIGTVIFATKSAMGQ
ncbi:MAG: hypothetical protein ACNI3C_11290 [Candidatus Marinarcus sp.]|uniref:hypothetical protein n=1 Tax=Candidatus Marinarcus sp. TaxID=3100987 RepID=UPI003AFF7145